MVGRDPARSNQDRCVVENKGSSGLWDTGEEKVTVIPEGVEKCECGHSCLLHYLKEDSDEYAACVLTDCHCIRYRPKGCTEGEGGRK
jgi:hypothetical protein